MRNRWVVPVLICAFVLSIGVLAVPEVSLGQRGAAVRDYDPRDLSGYWIGRTPRDNDHPPLTPAGIAMMAGRIPDSEADNAAESNEGVRSSARWTPTCSWDRTTIITIWSRNMRPSGGVRTPSWIRKATIMQSTTTRSSSTTSWRNSQRPQSEPHSLGGETS